MRLPILIFVLSILTFNVYADSPITSTFFYTAYYEIPEIRKAETDKILNYESASFLCSTTISSDKKVALINALGWDVNGKKNKELFENFLKKKYNISQIDYSKITADEHLCIGYLAIMDNYLEADIPVKILNAALKRNPQSYTYNIIYGLALCQLCLHYGSSSSLKPNELFDKKLVDESLSGWANVYLIGAKIESNKILRQDFRVSAKREIFAYLNDYKSECPAEVLILIPSTEHLTQLIDTKIKIIKKNGVFKIPVTVNNGLEIDFIFDSGASDVSISSDVFSTLKKQGKIDKSDILGYEYYTIADGTTIKQLSIMLRKVQIGKIVVTNIKASVGSFNTPLLLGQSFLEKFKEFTIDNENGYLIIDPKNIK